MEIEYKLARELKNAGFPQTGPLIYNNVGKLFLHSSESYCYCPKCTPWEQEYTTVPTLSELIEACGDKLWSLINGKAHRSGKWIAQTDEEDPGRISGDTPEEAVAKLWLELNKQ